MQEANLGSRNSCVLQVLDKCECGWWTKLITVVMSYIVHDPVAVFATFGVIFPKPLMLILQISLKNLHWGVPANIRLGWKWQTATDTLAYYDA